MRHGRQCCSKANCAKTTMSSARYLNLDDVRMQIYSVTRPGPEIRGYLVVSTGRVAQAKGHASLPQGASSCRVGASLGSLANSITAHNMWPGCPLFSKNIHMPRQAWFSPYGVHQSHEIFMFVCLHKDSKPSCDITKPY